MSAIIFDVDLLTFLKSRRSIREYEERQIPEEDLRKILDAARWAPTGANLQPWHFVVVRDEKLRKELGSHAKFFFLKSSHVEKAPCIIVLCYEKNKGRFGLFDVTLAGANIIMMAHSLNLGSCWIGAFDERGVKSLLGIPEEIGVVALITLGYPKEKPDPPPRLEIEKIVHYETWDNVLRKDFKDRFLKSGPLSIVKKLLKFLSI